MVYVFRGFPRKYKYVINMAQRMDESPSALSGRREFSQPNTLGVLEHGY